MRRFIGFLPMTKDDVLFDSKPIYAIVPAAGIGSRMQYTSAKQYLPLQGQAILSHTLSRLIAHPSIAQSYCCFASR